MLILNDLAREFRFKTSRSSGSGGQNVNKVSTKVELRFFIEGSELLSTEQKMLLKDKLQSRLTQDGELVMTSSSERTQLANKKKVVARALHLIAKALEPVKKRISTRQPASANEKRLNQKKQLAEKKSGRRAPGLE